jgi:N-acetylmuramic acid 6-phosphate (MurNAc-6-P) etherase
MPRKTPESLAKLNHLAQAGWAVEAIAKEQQRGVEAVKRVQADVAERIDAIKQSVSEEARKALEMASE